LIVIALFSAIFTMQTEGEIIEKILESFKSRPTKELFKAWHLLFKRSYSLDTEEAKSRFRIFKENLAYINENNAENNGLVLGLNQFSDLTNEEYRRQRLDSTFAQTYEELSREAESKAILSGTWQPDQLVVAGTYDPIDHTAAFLPPRNQATCGSCWAFATAGNVEGILAMANGGANKVYLSPQQLVDCDSGDGGCNGGWPANAFKYIIQYGLTAESKYPYQNKKNACNAALITSPVKIRSYDSCTNAAACNTNNFFYNMVKQGPVTVGLDASSKDFQSYRSGIMPTNNCVQPNHAVMTVGYGVQNGQGYWIIRNSWGAQWGNKGYIWIAHTPNATNGSCFLDRNGWLPKL
jgi:cathepsin L